MERQPAKRIPPTPPPPPAPASSDLDRLIVVVGHWTAALAKTLQTALGANIYDFATRLGAGWRTIVDWNTDPTIIPKWKMQHALDDVLRQASDEQKIKFAILTQGDPHVWVSDSLGLNGNGGNANRRDAAKTVTAAGLVAVFAPLGAALERITAAIANPDARVDARLVTDHEELADALAVLHSTSRPDALVDQAACHADALDRLLDRTMSPTDRRRLQAVTVGQCAQAGLLAWVRADHATASRYVALARSVADDSGDDTLRAQSLAVASALHSPIPSGGRRGDSRLAITLLERAVRHDGGQAWMHSWLATELANARNRRGFFDAIEAAARLSGRSDHTDGRGYFARHYQTEPALVSAQRGEGLALLGHGEAIETLRPGLALPWPRAKATLLAYAATAWVLQGEPEAACAALREALDVALAAGYLLGIERVLGVRARFDPQWADLPCVHELDERLRLVTRHPKTT